MASEFVLFAQHGWADTNQAIASLARSIVPEQTPIITPNLGWLRTWIRIEPLIRQVEVAAIEARQTYPNHAWRIMGHSMGGLIWIELLHRHPEWLPHVHSLTLVGSPIGGADLGRIIDPLGIGIAIAKDLGLNRRPLAAAIAQQIPTLVVAGDWDGGSDGTVTVECTKVPCTTSVILPGLSHATLKNHSLVGQAIQTFWLCPQVLPPEADTPSYRLIQRLQNVPGMTDAHHRNAHRGSILLTLADGSTLRTWQSPMGLPHVFVISQAGTCLYAGFVGWLHKVALDDALNEAILDQGEWNTCSAP